MCAGAPEKDRLLDHDREEDRLIMFVGLIAIITVMVCIWGLILLYFLLW